MTAMKLFTPTLLAIFVTQLAISAVFAQAPARNAPAPNPLPGAADKAGTAVPADYTIGAEDVLGVLFWRDTEMSGDLTVRPDGRITLPLIGDMMASGLKPEELKDRIQEASKSYVADANVSVVVRQINSRKVYITGQVTTPGAYPLAGPLTVMQLIALSGGLTEYADSKNITIMRVEGGQQLSFKFNYKDVARGKSLPQNIALRPLDTVVVP
jgi:polysaccharide biosynthesis/export protein